MGKSERSVFVVVFDIANKHKVSLYLYMQFKYIIKIRRKKWKMGKNRCMKNVHRLKSLYFILNMRKQREFIMFLVVVGAAAAAACSSILLCVLRVGGELKVVEAGKRGRWGL